MPHKSPLRELPVNPPENISKEKALKDLAQIKAEISRLQDILYASAEKSLLVVLQGLDGSGKDSTVNGVFSGINPLGIRVASFKKPTPEEEAHDFLWRVHKEVPRRRMITVFNRSHYEEAVLPMAHGGKSLSDIASRLEAINEFEKLLAVHGNTTLLKVFLHVSEEYQHDRMKKRRADPEKRWKYDPDDEAEIGLRNTFLDAWDGIIGATGDVAPWHIIPADEKWYRRYRLAQLVRDALAAMDLKYPDQNTSNL